MFLELDYPLGTSGYHHNYPKAAVNAMQYEYFQKVRGRPPAVQPSRTVTRKLWCTSQCGDSIVFFWGVSIYEENRGVEKKEYSAVLFLNLSRNQSNIDQ